MVIVAIAGAAREARSIGVSRGALEQVAKIDIIDGIKWLSI